MSRRKDKTPLAIVRDRVAAAFEAEQRRCRDWLKGMLSLFPLYWSGLVGAEHERRGGVDSSEANRWLLAAVEFAEGRRVPLSAGESDLRASAAIAVAQSKALVTCLQSPSPDEVLQEVAALAGRWGVRAPSARGGEVWPAVRRVLCARWWLRALRRVVAHDCEAAAVRAGLVRRGLWCYVSNDQLRRRRQQLMRQREAIQGAVLEEVESGEQCELDEVVKGSVANPAIKRGELMTRVRGCDEYAKGKGWSCEFWTITCPSRYHAQVTTGPHSSVPNPKYEGKAPRDGQMYLREVWARARAAWDRRGLQVSGLRTAEPHHDACPHWHLVAYGPADDLEQARELLRAYALQDSPDEPGAQERRFVHLVSVDGSGAAYAAKYIAKNIDGANLGEGRDNETGRKLSGMAERVSAWAAAWRIRQFQFWGMPGVTVWRVLRKVGEVCQDSAVVEAARLAADAGDWCAYWSAAEGGLMLLKEEEGRLTEYGDEGSRRVLGVSDGVGAALLAVRSWVINWGAKRAKVAEAVTGGRLVSLDLGR